MIPNHSFHPLFIHFPLALYLFGVGLLLLDLKKPGFAEGGRWNVWGAALSSLPSLGTGLAALLRMGFGWPPSGITFWHSLLAVIASILMWVTLGLWSRRGAALWITVACGSISLAIAGHLGAILVHG